MALAYAGISKMRVSEYAGHARKMISFFEESEDFDEAGARLEAMKDHLARLDQVRQETAAAEQRLNDLKFEMNEVHKDISQTTRQLVAYVNDASKGSRDILIRGPFPIKKKPKPLKIKGKVVALKVAKVKGAGAIKLRWKGLPSIRQYVVQYSVNPTQEDAWQTYWLNPRGTSLTLNLDVENLLRELSKEADTGDRAPTAPRVSFRVAGLVRNTMGLWSDPIQAFVVP